jgi:hypothetical protein
MYADIFEVVQQAAGQGNNQTAQGGVAGVAQAPIPQAHNVLDDQKTNPFYNGESSVFLLAYANLMAKFAAAPDIQYVDRYVLKREKIPAD